MLEIDFCVNECGTYRFMPEQISNCLYGNIMFYQPSCKGMPYGMCASGDDARPAETRPH
jgi:hypothetical protein